jgi:D-hydroxyproline dehydrogenase subunit beta
MPITNHFDVAIVGAGIVGLAHAWMASLQGLRVLVCDRSPQPQGASVRNFGMVWPIGQDPEGHAIALRSRQRWLELASTAGIWAEPCGSIHLAHHDDEWKVLQEFTSLAGQGGYECQLLTPQEVHRRTPAAQPDGLRGGLWSPSELCVSPREALNQIPNWLARKHQVEFHWKTAIQQVTSGQLEASDGRHWEAEKILVCGGADLLTLFPNQLRQAGLRCCKLQMLKTTPQPPNWRLGPHLAGGLTLRHYENFAPCTSLTELRRRIAEQTPELDQFGIHVMAAQNQQGELILGDSHEYDDAIEPFDKQRIDELILRELRKIVRLPSWELTERWHGIYCKHPTERYHVQEPLAGVHLITATGGAGMTLAFGLAERFWQTPAAEFEAPRNELRAE